MEEEGRVDIEEIASAADPGDMEGGVFVVGISFRFLLTQR